MYVAVLAQAALRDAGRDRQLGATAKWEGDRLLIERVMPAGWAWDAGVRPGDTIVAIDGRPVLPETPASLAASATRLDVVRPSGEARFAPLGYAPLASDPLHQASFPLLGFALALVAGMVFVVARQVVTAAVLLAVAATSSTMLVASLAQVSGAPWSLVLTAAAFIGFGLSTVSLFLSFPVDRTKAGWGRGALPAAFVAHGALALAYLVTVFLANSAYDVLQKVLFSVVTLDFLAAVGLLVAAIADPRTRQEAGPSLQLLAIGAVVSFLPFALLSLAPFALGFGYLVPPDISILSLVCLPASIGAALLSRQFMGATRLLRRGMVALGVWVTLLALYSLFWNLVDRWLASFDPARLVDSAVLVIAVIAGTFPFAQRWARRQLEGWLFRDVYDYAPTLRALSDELTHLQGVEPIAAHALNRLGSTLDLAWAELVVGAPGQQRTSSWASSAPAPPRLADAAASASRRIPLLVEHRRVGELVVGPKRQDIDLLPEDHSLLETVAPMLATALENALLLDQLQEQVAILTEREGQLTALSAQLLRTQEEERARLALDIHDDPLQRALFLARQLAEATGSPLDPRWRQEAEEIVHSLKAICAGLRPPTLEDFGLPAGLEWLLTELRAKTEIDGSLEVSTPEGEPFGRLDPELELALYRVGQEAINNCVKHSGAERVHIRLHRGKRGISLRIRDNGQGFAVEKSANGNGRFHLGLMGMSERLRPWGGAVEVQSEPGAGTLVVARIPAERAFG